MSSSSSKALLDDKSSPKTKSGRQGRTAAWALLTVFMVLALQNQHRMVSENGVASIDDRSSTHQRLGQQQPRQEQQQAATVFTNDDQQRIQRRSAASHHLFDASTRRNVTVFVCNDRYGPAVAETIVSLRRDGGYHGDVAVIVDEQPSSGNTSFSIHHFQTHLLTLYKSHNDLNETSKTNNGTEATSSSNNAFPSVYFYTVTELMDSLLATVVVHDDDHDGNEEQNLLLTDTDGSNHSSQAQHHNFYSKHHEHLRSPPPVGSCNNGRGHRAYYLKSLIWHPVFAARWDTVLYMDGCMTIHRYKNSGPPPSGDVPLLFSMRQIHNTLLAQPDPWRWGRNMLQGKVLRCATPNATRRASELMGGRDLRQTPYFASGFMMYDTSLISHHGSNTSSTLLELLQVYHELGGTVFFGDQEVFSVYWAWMRHVYEPLPLTIFGTNKVPYEFMNRLHGPDEKHVVTAGHATREICLARPTNQRSINS